MFIRIQDVILINTFQITSFRPWREWPNGHTTSGEIHLACGGRYYLSREESDLVQQAIEKGHGIL